MTGSITGAPAPCPNSKSCAAKTMYLICKSDVPLVEIDWSACSERVLNPATLRSCGSRLANGNQISPKTNQCQAPLALIRGGINKNVPLIKSVARMSGCASFSCVCVCVQTRRVINQSRENLASYPGRQSASGKGSFCVRLVLVPVRF